MDRVHTVKKSSDFSYITDLFFDYQYAIDETAFINSENIPTIPESVISLSSFFINFISLPHNTYYVVIITSVCENIAELI